MHDIDRVRLETQSDLLEARPFEAEQFEYGEAETPSQAETGEVFGEGRADGAGERVARDLKRSRARPFLGDLIKRAGQAVGKFVSSPEGRALGGALRGAAKQVLPAIGSAVGGYLGGPTGAQLGGQAASAAGRMFGLELEGLSAEDREFEVARRYVDLAGEAVKNLALAPSSSDPRAAAHTALALAAQTHAPGLLRAEPPMGTEPPESARLPMGHSGRWLRRGNKIVLYGI
jgi:hypothetical protein